MEFNGQKFVIKVAEGLDLKEFWNKHGDHYQMCLKNMEKSLRESEREDAKKNILFLGKKYANMVQLKTVFKNIITRTANGERIKEPYNNMLKEILKNHDKCESKTKDLEHFTVDVHPVHSDSRCFFIVKGNGEKEDFSVIKCIENLARL